MAPCCQNYVTPTMIKKGQVTVGDHIRFEDSLPVSGSFETHEEITENKEIQASKEIHETEPVVETAAAAPSPGSAMFTHTGQNTVNNGNNSSTPLVYDQMTEYIEALNNPGVNTPSFTIPTHPLAPPDYDQTIDYDSAQYMNGFLRTQIGRGMLVQQLIGSGSTVDRYGFLVGVGNNYLLLQDYTNGNIMVIDFYTVKYVYIYYSQIVFPSFVQPAEQ